MYSSSREYYREQVRAQLTSARSEMRGLGADYFGASDFSVNFRDQKSQILVRISGISVYQRALNHESAGSMKLRTQLREPGGARAVSRPPCDTVVGRVSGQSSHSQAPPSAPAVPRAAAEQSDTTARCQAAAGGGARSRAPLAVAPAVEVVAGVTAGAGALCCGWWWILRL